MKVILALILIGLLLVVFGCTGAVQKPAQEGTNCTNNQACFGEAFMSCKKAFGNLALDVNNEFYFQVMEQEGNRCKTYVQMVKAQGVPDFFNGLDAICKIDVQEVISKGFSIDISKQNCVGPLYDAYQTVKAVS